MVSLAERALALQLLRLKIDGDAAKVRLEASFEQAGSTLELVRVEHGAALWRTAESGKTLAIAARARLDVDRQFLSKETSELKWTWTWQQESGQVADFIRLSAFAKGGENEDDTQRRAAHAITQAEAAGWRAVLTAHEQAWMERWRLADIEIAGDAKIQQALRFAIYHLNSAVNPDDHHVSIGTRALTGDAYFGHVFWDTEIFLLPFYIFTWPEAARALLMYRYHTLPAARAKAAKMGYRGALYAWESADTGEETTPEQVLDPEGHVIPILCGLYEHHISADIAYAVWQYWQATLDNDFFRAAGAEILVETARFWASRATLESDGRYHIRGVIGPDEYHEIIDDNAFTNMMAAWTIARGLDAIAELGKQWPAHQHEIRQRLALDDGELGHWTEVAKRLVRGDDPVTGMIEQFAGYFRLEDIDLCAYAGRAVPMDVILGRERTRASQIIKQADVVALFALLPDMFDRTTKQRNFSYYEPRCGHGSTLSPALHALVAARLGDIGMAERYLHATAEIDLGSPNISSAGGVHIAALGGLWLAVIFGFAGLRMLGEELAFDPIVPEGWQAFAFRIQWRHCVIHVRIDPRRHVLTATLEVGERTVLACGRRCPCSRYRKNCRDSTSRADVCIGPLGSKLVLGPARSARPAHDAGFGRRRQQPLGSSRAARRHGHVAAVLGPTRHRSRSSAGTCPQPLRTVIAMIVARLIASASKLATARMLDPLTAASSLGAVLGLGPVDEDELYVALDWLGERHPALPFWFCVQIATWRNFR